VDLSDKIMIVFGSKRLVEKVENSAEIVQIGCITKKNMIDVLFVVIFVGILNVQNNER
jgi:hypothetical protein